MKQAILIKPGVLQYRDVAIPEPSEDEVLLKVKAIGICGSDIHTFHGAHPFVSTPAVLGHEATGEIVKKGKAVKDFAVGDRVVIRPQVTCGVCRLCKQGRYNICEKLNVIGCSLPGPSSEFFAINSKIIYKLPENISYHAGTLIEPLAVGIHAVKRGSNVEGGNVLVTGAGTVGNLTAQAAKGLGAKSVIITDISDFKLDIARKCGIDHCVNVKERDLKEELKKIYGDEGVSLILDCSAVEASLNLVIAVAPKGIDIVIVGIFESLPRTNLADVQDKEYSLIGSLMYTHEDYLTAIDLIENKKICLDNLITNVFPLSKNLEAYQYIDENRDTTQKVIIEI